MRLLKQAWSVAVVASVGAAAAVASVAAPPSHGLQSAERAADQNVGGSPYPPVGKVAIVDFGRAKFRLSFTDSTMMSFTDASGAFHGVRDTVHYTAIAVSRDVFMV